MFCVNGIPFDLSHVDWLWQPLQWWEQPCTNKVAPTPLPLFTSNLSIPANLKSVSMPLMRFIFLRFGF